MELGDLLRLGVLLLAAGCGGSESEPTSTGDAQAPIDAGDATIDAPQVIVDAGHGDGQLGAPCTTDNQCAGALCLGGAFSGGYCSSPVAECDPGSGTYWCGDGGECRKTGGVDIDGAAAGEFCLHGCHVQHDCRAGYACCAAGEYPQFDDAGVCAPPSFCPDQ
jgi:hypothetical protein